MKKVSKDALEKRVHKVVKATKELPFSRSRQPRTAQQIQRSWVLSGLRHLKAPSVPSLPLGVLMCFFQGHPQQFPRCFKDLWNLKKVMNIACRDEMQRGFGHILD